MRLDNYAIPGFSIKVSCSLSIEGTSLSGQTSATDAAHQGFKPKQFNVSLELPYKYKSQLTELMNVAEALGEAGKRKVYTLIDETGNAMNVRQVQFASTVAARPADKIKAWQINFGLQEFQSVPEKVEKQQQQTTATAVAPAGIQIIAAATVEPAQEVQPLTGFERVLQKMDNALA